MIIGILAYFWVVLMLGRMIDQVVPSELILSGQLLEAVRSIIYLVPLIKLGPVSGIDGPLVSYIVYLLVPVGIVGLSGIYVDSRRQLTCPECERAFALKCLGCFNQSGDRTPI